MLLGSTAPKPVVDVVKLADATPPMLLLPANVIPRKSGKLKVVV